MDELMIDKLRKQNPVIQEQFYKQYGARMFRICYRYLGNENDASEVLNEGFFRALTHINTFKDGGIDGLLAWIRKIMINQCLQYIRNRRNNRFFDELDTIIENITVVQDLQIDAELYFGQISQLHDNYRTVFNLYVIDGYSHKEISNLLGIGEATSRSYLFRARLELQEKIEKLQSYGTARK